MQRQARDRQTDKGRFLEIARDPRIVPGLHRACDEWCDYCPVTDRCLLFQCTREFLRARRRPLLPAGFRTAAEAIEFAREFALVDVAPAARTAAAGRAPSEPALTDDDVLAAVALEYARRSRAFVTSAPAITRRSRRGEPPPVDAVLRFHERIYFKMMRALVGYRVAAAGLAHRCTDATTCAGQTLSYIDRSRDALAHFENSDERRTLAAQLDALARAIEARFPEAGAVIRDRKKIHAA